MIVWCLLLGYVVMVRMIQGELCTPKSRRNYLLNVGLVSALVIGCRGNNYDNVYDLTVYTQFFSEMLNTPWNKIFICSDFERGFTILTKLLTYLSANPQMMIFASSVICIGSVSYFIYKNTHYVFEAFYFFFTLGTMGFMLTGLRQGIAISIGLIAFEFIRRKKLLPFVITCLVAFSVHKSSLVLLISYFLVNNGFKNDSKLIYFIIIVLMFVLAPYILSFGNLLVDGELEYNDDPLFSFNGIVPIIIYIGCVFIEYPRWKMLTQIGNYKDKLNRLPLISLGLGFYLFRFFSPVLQRLAFYYTPVSVLCLGDYMGKSSIPVKFVLYIFSVFLFLKRFSSADYGNFVFFWNLL